MNCRSFSGSDSVDPVPTHLSPRVVNKTSFVTTMIVTTTKDSPDVSTETITIMKTSSAHIITTEASADDIPVGSHSKQKRLRSQNAQERASNSQDPGNSACFARRRPVVTVEMFVTAVVCDLIDEVYVAATTTVALSDLTAPRELNLKLRFSLLKGKLK